MSGKGLFTGLKGRFRKRREASLALSATPSPEIQSPEQGDARHSSKPSSSLTIAPCVPPCRPAADANPILPNEDASVFSSHPPAAPSQASPPAVPSDPEAVIEATDQDTPTLPASQRLWNAAYDSLERDDAELVAGYVKTLGKVLGASPDDPGTDISAELHDPTKRQVHMTKLVEEGQAKISRASKITNRVGEVADAILSIKTLVDLAVQSVPQAALPWAGVCVGLQILLNPIKATKSNLSGITHVISRMDWYCALSEHLLSRSNIAHGNDFQAVLHQLEGSVVELYKAL